MHRRGRGRRSQRRDPTTSVTRQPRHAARSITAAGRSGLPAKPGGSRRGRARPGARFRRSRADQQPEPGGGRVAARRPDSSETNGRPSRHGAAEPRGTPAGVARAWRGHGGRGPEASERPCPARADGRVGRTRADQRAGGSAQARVGCVLAARRTGEPGAGVRWSPADQRPAPGGRSRGERVRPARDFGGAGPVAARGVRRGVADTGLSLAGEARPPTAAGRVPPR